MFSFILTTSVLLLKIKRFPCQFLKFRNSFAALQRAFSSVLPQPFSQNCRGQKGALENISSKPSAQSRLLRTTSRRVLSISVVGDYITSGQSIPVFYHSPVKKKSFFLCLNGILCCYVCLLSQSSTDILAVFTSSHEVFLYFDSVFQEPWLLQDEWPQVSQPLSVQHMLQSLTNFHGSWLFKRNLDRLRAE